MEVGARRAEILSAGTASKAGLTEKLSRISKALIVEVYGRGTSPDGRDYEILEFIRHGTLADFGKGGLPEAKVREVLRELTDAVAACTLKTSCIGTSNPRMCWSERSNRCNSP